MDDTAVEIDLFTFNRAETVEYGDKHGYLHHADCGREE